jgi:hypothetical protein
MLEWQVADVRNTQAAQVVEWTPAPVLQQIFALVN